MRGRSRASAEAPWASSSPPSSLAASTAGWRWRGFGARLRLAPQPPILLRHLLRYLLRYLLGHVGGGRCVVVLGAGQQHAGVGGVGEDRDRLGPPDLQLVGIALAAQHLGEVGDHGIEAGDVAGGGAGDQGAQPGGGVPPGGGHVALVLGVGAAAFVPGPVGGDHRGRDHLHRPAPRQTHQRGDAVVVDVACLGFGEPGRAGGAGDVAGLVVLHLTGHHRRPAPRVPVPQVECVGQQQPRGVRGGLQQAPQLCGRERRHPRSALPTHGDTGLARSGCVQVGPVHHPRHPPRRHQPGLSHRVVQTISTRPQVVITDIYSLEHTYDYKSHADFPGGGACICGQRSSGSPKRDC